MKEKEFFCNMFVAIVMGVYIGWVFNSPASNEEQMLLDRIDLLESQLDFKRREMEMTSDTFKKEVDSLKKYSHFEESRCILMDRDYLFKHMRKPS